MIFKKNNHWGVGVITLLFLAGCGDDKAPTSQVSSSGATSPSSQPCVHEPPVNELVKPAKPAPRSPIESYARKVSSNNMKKHLSGVGIAQDKISASPSDSSDECKARVAARYQECLKSAKENDPSSKRRCEVFKQWFRDRCQSSAGGTSQENSSKISSSNKVDSSENKLNK